MLAIKFKKTGKKHQKHLRVIVAEKKSKLNGKNVDDVGWVNPYEKTARLDKEKILYWIGAGAKPTPSVLNLLIKNKIVKGKKVPVHAKSKKERKAEPASAPQTEKTEQE
ncbi:MAG: 30S ribosomal protein S16 [Nanoarchaeota archaeon]|nr:30S ribosomal protein S16 [Nanoarchaeota archaeon]